MAAIATCCRVSDLHHLVCLLHQISTKTPSMLEAVKIVNGMQAVHCTYNDASRADDGCTRRIRCVILPSSDRA